MKALTVKQPWASLIVSGLKDIENRTWPCPKKYIGQRVLIHSAMRFIDYNFTELQYKRLCELKIRRSYDYDLKKSCGLILGSVEIVDCVVNHPSIWAEKTLYKISESNRAICEKIEEFETLRDGSNLLNPIYNWVLANPVKFPEPIPCKGKLSFWDYPNILAEPEEKNGDLFCHCQLPVKEENQVMYLIGEYRCRYCGAKWYK